MEDDKSSLSEYNDNFMDIPEVSINFENFRRKKPQKKTLGYITSIPFKCMFHAPHGISW